MFAQFFTALSTAMGLTKENVALFMRVGWVLIVSTHIAYVCGVLAFFGIVAAPPFARASDVNDIQRMMKISARVNLQSEIRAQVEAYCGLPAGNSKQKVADRIESLRLELRQIEPNAEVPPTVCP